MGGGGGGGGGGGVSGGGEESRHVEVSCISLKHNEMYTGCTQGYGESLFACLEGRGRVARVQMVCQQ